MNFKAAPLNGRNQSWSRGDIVRKVPKLVEQNSNRALEFFDAFPDGE